MKKYIDAAANFGKDYWDLGLTAFGGAVMNNNLLGQYNFFGDYDNLVGGAVYMGAGFFAPMFLNLDSVPDKYRFCRAIRNIFLGTSLLHDKMPDSVGDVIGTGVGLSLGIVSEYCRRCIVRDTAKAETQPANPK